MEQQLIPHPGRFVDHIRLAGPTRWLSSDVHVTIFREDQFKASTLDLPPNALRAELAGHFDGDESTDPFGPELREVPGVSNVEVCKRKPSPGAPALPAAAVHPRHDPRDSDHRDPHRSQLLP
jgi:hypothetical protein